MAGLPTCCLQSIQLSIIMPLTQNPFEIRLRQSSSSLAVADSFVDLLLTHNIETDNSFVLRHDSKISVYKFKSRVDKENALLIPNLNPKLAKLKF